MQFVVTEGQLQLEPIPGSTEGSRSGYLIKSVDARTGIEVVLAMDYRAAVKFGEALVEDTSTHPESPPPIQVVGAGVLDNLKGVPLG